MLVCSTLSKQSLRELFEALSASPAEEEDGLTEHCCCFPFKFSQVPLQFIVLDFLQITQDKQFISLGKITLGFTMIHQVSNTVRYQKHSVPRSRIQLDSAIDTGVFPRVLLFFSHSDGQSGAVEQPQ